jgi:hypothetical protein
MQFMRYQLATLASPTAPRRPPCSRRCTSAWRTS